MTTIKSLSLEWQPKLIEPRFDYLLPVSKKTKWNAVPLVSADI